MKEVQCLLLQARTVAHAGPSTCTSALVPLKLTTFMEGVTLELSRYLWMLDCWLMWNLMPSVNDADICMLLGNDMLQGIRRLQSSADHSVRLPL
ncbi:hypothetical protein M0R45_006309 [Rubus argutus]|uniref:Uncharacterized protein n=1 Tax=Rubus argutus TaxID=59490 RepID=A0AAW1YQN5_RUBAR